MYVIYLVSDKSSLCICHEIIINNNDKDNDNENDNDSSRDNDIDIWYISVVKLTFHNLFSKYFARGNCLYKPLFCF